MVALASGLRLSADEALRPAVKVFTAGIGHARALDTYVTPLRYSGTAYHLGYEHVQATGFNPHEWIRQLEAGVEYAYIKNPTGNHNMHELLIDLDWGMMRRWSGVLTSGLQLMAGAGIGIMGGAIYKPTNSNNLVSAKAEGNLDARVMAVYNTHLGRLPITLRGEAKLPVLGVMYSPQYDESYYEMYVGNHSGLAHTAWWGNRFEMHSALMVDLHLGATVLSVGYRYRRLNTDVENINTRLSSHMVVIGVGGEFISLRPGKGVTQKEVISSIY